ncbi:MAG TPA: hypothetical protein VJN21_04020 [Candidatus Acidoferrales bacterium]|nr:hypothetical protein [Candidatus Acidoferrales bacterium]
MNEISTFLIGIGLTIVITTAALCYLQPHMRSILTELCGTSERAHFWMSLSNVTLFLTPLIFALRIQPQAGTVVTLIYAMGNQVSLALLGLVLAIGIVGIVISKFIPLKPPETPLTEQISGRAVLK